MTQEQIAHPKLSFFDAEEQLSKFMVDDWPSESRFRRAMEEILGQARESGPTRIFGEMVAVLWGKGYTRAALRLEELWNKLVEEYSFTLLCAYPRQTLSLETDNDVRAISQLHTRVYTQSAWLDREGHTIPHY